MENSEENYLPREIKLLVIHCSATRCNVSFTVEQLRQCHLQRGFKDIGYHFYITVMENFTIVARYRSPVRMCEVSTGIVLEFAMKVGWMKKVVRRIREHRRSASRYLTCWRFSNINIRMRKSWDIINLVLRFIRLVPVLTVEKSIWIYKKNYGSSRKCSLP